MKAYQNKGPEAPASKPASIIKPNGVSIVQRCRNPVPQANMRPPPHVYSGFWNSLMAGRPGIPEMQRPLNPRPQNLQPYIPPMRRLGSQSMDRPVLIPPRPMLNQAFVPPKTEPIIKETQAAPPTDFSNLITSEVNQQTEALKKILRIKSYGMPTGTMPGNPPVYPLSRLPGYEPCRNNFRNITSVPQGNDSNQVKSGTFYSNNRKPTMETSSFNNQKVSHPEEEKVNTMFVPPQVQQVEASRKATPPPPPAAPTRQAQAPPSAPTQTTKPEPRRGGRKLRIAANFNTPLNRDST